MYARVTPVIEYPAETRVHDDGPLTFVRRAVARARRKMTQKPAVGQAEEER